MAIRLLWLRVCLKGDSMLLGVSDWGKLVRTYRCSLGIITDPTVCLLAESTEEGDSAWHLRWIYIF